MYLFINTASNDKITVALAKAGFLSAISQPARRRQSEKLLPAIAKLLKQNKTSFHPPAGGNLKGIIVASGPGSFTSLRIGIAVANTLGYCFNLPVVGVKEKENSEEMIKEGIKKLKKIKKFKVVLPFYGGEPNITITNNR
ncbi:MAG: tRNA (adenosine(37)-N6)-threonylcarbamoyltransferase complex dimerization subunit type 1 TsaB [bacterium]